MESTCFFKRLFRCDSFEGVCPTVGSSIDFSAALCDLDVGLQAARDLREGELDQYLSPAQAPSPRSQPAHPEEHDWHSPHHAHHHHYHLRHQGEAMAR